MTPLPLSLPGPDRGCDVVTLGEASIDFVALLGQPLRLDAKMPIADFRILPGGQAATVAVGCARQGWRARFIGALGRDRWGDDVRRTLAAEHVDAVVADRPGVESRTAMILVDEATGSRTVLEHRAAALTIAPGEVPVAAITAARILVVDASHADAAVEAARQARAAGLATIVDLDAATEPAVRLLREIDVAIVARSFLADFAGGPTGEALRQLAGRFRPTVAIATLGEDGSLAVCGGHEVHTPALAVRAVDTTGAGDAFRAGFASAWLAEPDLPDLDRLLRWATVTAGLNCRALGAQSGLPTRAEVEAHL